VCQGLRSRDFEGEIILVKDEERPPYDRPPLSKQLLAFEWEIDRVALLAENDFDRLGLEVRSGPSQKAVGLDVAARRLALASGGSLDYDGLAIATGSRARALPGLEAPPGAHVLRTIEDCLALREAISETGVRLLIVGGGFIGMEVAATARQLGAEVTVVEPFELPLYALLGPVVGRAAERLHQERGVELCLGTSLKAVVEPASRGEGDGTKRVELLNGVTLAADVILICVGAVPNLEWLEGSGLSFSAGVECDATLQAAPGVVAAGDVARWPRRPGEGSVRVEHRTNAAEQGDHAAATLLGSKEPFDVVPYVWSDQYEVKIQVLGLPERDDECLVVDGDEEEGRFLALYGREGVLTGAVGFSMPRQLMKMRGLLSKPTRFAEAVEAGSAS
jgi:3-phenylpropionate/trans-cinnamate dioxygenase ferredoxin reductase subunit